MLRVGGTVFGFADPKSTSTAKGETLKDTIKMVSGYADVVVMRNPKEGAGQGGLPVLRRAGDQRRRRRPVPTPPRPLRISPPSPACGARWTGCPWACAAI